MSQEKSVDTGGAGVWVFVVVVVLIVAFASYALMSGSSSDSDTEGPEGQTDVNSTETVDNPEDLPEETPPPPELP